MCEQDEFVAGVQAARRWLQETGTAAQLKRLQVARRNFPLFDLRTDTKAYGKRIASIASGKEVCTQEECDDFWSEVGMSLDEMPDSVFIDGFYCRVVDDEEGEVNPI